MKPRSIFAAALTLLFCATAVPATQLNETQPRDLRDVAYVVTVEKDADLPRVHIEVVFEGDADGESGIYLPNSWGGQDRLDGAIRNLNVHPTSARLVDTDTPHIKKIQHKPKARLRIRYELVQETPGPAKAGRGAGYRPLLQPEYIHWIGHGGWVLPDWPDDEVARITVAWKGLPKTWTIANSFGASNAWQRVEATVSDFSHAVFMAGDFRIRKLDISGRTVVVAMRGVWKFTDEAYADLVARIFRVERDFWSDHSRPYYLVSLIPLDGPPTALSIGGTGLVDSFATFVTTNTELPQLRFLLAHELFHEWNPQSLGKVEEPERGMYWFTEGFTDYYTYALLRRSGLLSDDEYAEHYNELLREYTLSPVRNATNERILKDFFSDEAVGRLPYWRGALLAMRWDARIRARSGGKSSLDAVMLKLFEDAKRDRQRVVTNALIAGLIEPLAGGNVMAEITAHVTNGETIEPAPDGAGPGYELVRVEILPFELGFDLDALLQKKVIAGVVPGSAAERAGLRNGQTLVQRKPIHITDPTKPVEMTVKDGDVERSITYLPTAAKGPIVAQYRKR